MVNYYIYAKDYSGSTGGNKYFHTNGMKSLEQFKNHVEKIKNKLLATGEPPTESKIIYLHWGDHCYEVNEKFTKESYIGNECGNMGTNPETIIQWIRSNYNICGATNKIQLLYIITDGLIDHRSTKKCFELNQNMQYEMVVFHAFNESLNEIDLSVAAPFLKGRCSVYRNYNLFDNVDLSEEFNYNKINIDNFDAEKDSLKSYIQLKFINTSRHDIFAIKETEKLTNLRNRLFVELSSKSQKTEVNLNTKDKNVFLREYVNTNWYRNLIAPDYDMKVYIEKFISTLINYIISGKKSYSFDALKFDVKFNKHVAEEPIVDVNFTAEQEIEFPDIILDDEKGVPVIILTKFSLLDKIIFHKNECSGEVSPASFSKFRSTMECPLFLLNDPDVSESIGYFYTLNVYKQFLQTMTNTEPRTRKPFHGGIVLTDTDQFDKYNDYILAATYFNFKRVKFNIGLFYYVLWKNCENKEWMDRNVVEHFKKYVMRRISTTECNVGLSSLPLDPQEKTSLLTALWYCVELSSCIFKNDPQNFMHERLRMYYGVAHCMIEILKYFDYDLDLESIEKRTDIIRHIMILKRIPRYEEKVYYLLERIFKNVNGFLVSEIEKPFNLNKLNYLKLNHKGMLCDNAMDGEVHLNDYVHLMHLVGDVNEVSTDSFKICENTYRPFFTIEQNKSFYTELCRITKKVSINNDDDEDNINITYNTIDALEFDRILSLYNLFIKCVNALKKYPTLPEYIDFVSRKKKYNGHLVTIFPPNVCLNIENVYSHYQNIVTKVDVHKFIDVYKKYVTRSDRIKAEQVVKFNNDNEINEFIANEEKKVFLKKKD